MADAPNTGVDTVEGGAPNNEAEQDPQVSDQKDQIGDMLSAFKGQGGKAVTASEEQEGEDAEDMEGQEGSDAADDEEGDGSELSVLRAELAEMKQMLAQRGQDDEGAASQQFQTPTLELEPVDLITQEDLPSADEETLAKLNKRFNDALGTVAQQIIASVPRLATAQIQQQASMQKTVTDFYESNPDLLERRSYVGFVANQMISENPGVSMDKLLPKVAEKVRKDLNLKKQASNRERKRRQTDKKTFANTNGSRSGAGGNGDEPDDPQQKQMLRMLEAHKG